MPYKDKAQQSRYQLAWMRQRREAWVDENGPCVDCDSWEALEVDHEDSHKKITHNVWSWSKERRDKELAKCVVRCHDCHVTKTRLHKERPHGEQHRDAVLTEQSVKEIRSRYNLGGITQRQLVEEYGVKRETITSLINRRSWTHI